KVRWLKRNLRWRSERRLRWPIHQHVELRLRVRNSAENIGLCFEQLGCVGLRSEHIGLTGVANLVALPVYFGELIEQIDVALVYFELRIFVRQPMKGRAGAREQIELCTPKILEDCAGFGRRCSCPAQIFS